MNSLVLLPQLTLTTQPPVTFSAPFHFFSRLSPKRPFTCQHELILSCYLILSYLHTPLSFILSLKIIAHDSYQDKEIYLSTLGHPVHRGHRTREPEDA